jgi:hypothetical protein
MSSNYDQKLLTTIGRSTYPNLLWIELLLRENHESFVKQFAISIKFVTYSIGSLWWQLVDFESYDIPICMIESTLQYAYFVFPE